MAIEINLKICTKCKIDLPCTEEFFYKEKYGLKSQCRKCIQQYKKNYYNKIDKNIHGEYRLQNRARIRANNNKRYHANKEKAKCRNLQSRFNIKIEQFNKMLIEQNYLCAICKKPETAKQNDKIQALSVDHNHKTGKIRSLLCQGCNQGLGNFKESCESLIEAIKYIEKFKGNE